jgi:hypothetical protein
MEAFKLAGSRKIRLKSLVFPIMAALVISTFSGMWAFIHLCYKEGALSRCIGFPGPGVGYESFNWAASAIDPGFTAQSGRWLAVLLASGLIALLTLLRSRFIWFPFHPLGYCVGPWAIWLWMPFMIAWFCKLIVLRYGGLRLYRAVLPFFFGLVLGDYACGALWSLIEVHFHIPTCRMFH